MNNNSKRADAEPKVVPTSKATKAKQHTSRSPTKADKLLCRYCGGDDLAPSFKRRRNARCRTCFKKRYGSGRLRRAASWARTRPKKQVHRRLRVRGFRIRRRSP
jgi:hypothetical protein